MADKINTALEKPIRAEGFYWVKVRVKYSTKERWIVCNYFNNMWTSHGADKELTDDVFIDIDERRILRDN